MSNNLRTRNGMPFNFVNGLKVRGMDIESLIPGIEGIPEAGSKYQFAGNGSNKAFTLPVTPYNKDAVDVYVKQLYVHPDDYTLVGDTVTLTEAPPAVVAGETYNVVIKVSLTTLNGYVNANRVSFEGDNLDVILQKSKPVANYAALRAYAGGSLQVRITDPAAAGFFYYDAADTTSVDNGSTVIVSANGKRWKRVFNSAEYTRYSPTGSVSATTVQAAISELDSEKVAAVDLAASGGASKVGYTPAGAGAVATTVQSKLRETVSVKDFGCVCDGVTDDTLNFRKAVNYAMDTGVRLLTLGQLRITDEIEINKTVWISGTGTSSPEFGKTESLIKFDNNTVDGSGNATKALFRFTNANLYQVAGCQIENLVVKHIQQTPKSQHTIIIDTLYTEDLQFRNIRVDDATGYIFWMTASGGNYTPGLHNPTFNNINGRNVGGIFGQSASAKTWVVGADVQQINLEVAINPVSPGKILCDFSGFRVSTFDNFILEGTGSAATTTTIKNTGPLNTYTSIWIEFPTNPQTYNIDTSATVELNGLLVPGKIKASEAETVVTCRGLSADWTSNADRVELLRGARIVVEQAFSYGYYNVTRPVVPINQAGRVKFRDTPTAAGASYSHDYSRCLFQLDRAKSITVPTSAAPLSLNSYVEIETFGTPSVLIYPGLSGQEGRVLTVNPYGSDKVPKIRFRVKNLADYYGSSLTIGIRYSVSTSDTGSIIRVPEYVNGAAENVTVSNLPNMTHISNIYTRGSGAQNAYISIGQISGNVVFELANITGATGVHSIVISDIQVWLGNNLPSLEGYSVDPLTWRAADIPGLGYHVAGDVIFNNSGAATNGWRRKTTGSGNTLGTDWIAF